MVRHDPTSDDIREKKRLDVIASLAKRHEQRLEESKTRKEANSANSVPYEIIEEFNRDFGDLLSQIDAILTSSDSSTIESIDSMLDWLAKAKTLLASSASILPTYDVDHSQSKLTEYEGKIQEKRKQGGKKKFSFKNAKKVARTVAKVPAEETQSKEAASSSQTNSEETEIIDPNRSVQGISGEAIVVGVDKLGEGEPGDYSLSTLTNCQVRILGLTTALRLSRLSNCTIICAPVMGSIFVQNCENIIVHTASRQIRIHDTKNSSFYIYTQSRPTIETCNSLKFGPYNLNHPSMETWLSQCGFNLERNEWENVQDFNWLRLNSPNWSKIPEEDRKLVNL